MKYLVSIAILLLTTTSYCFAQEINTYWYNGYCYTIIQQQREAVYTHQLHYANSFYNVQPVYNNYIYYQPWIYGQQIINYDDRIRLYRPYSYPRFFMNHSHYYWYNY